MLRLIILFVISTIFSAKKEYLFYDLRRLIFRSDENYAPLLSKAPDNLILDKYFSDKCLERITDQVITDFFGITCTD